MVLVLVLSVVFLIFSKIEGDWLSRFKFLLKYYEDKLHLFLIINSYLTPIIFKWALCYSVNNKFLRSVLSLVPFQYHHVSPSAGVHSHTNIGFNEAGKAKSRNYFAVPAYAKQVTVELLRNS